MDKAKIVASLNKNYKLDGIWRRALKQILPTGAYLILDTLFDFGEFYYFSQNVLLKSTKLSKETFYKYRNQLIEMGAISVVSGYKYNKDSSEKGKVTEYHRNNEVIADLIMEGNYLLLKEGLFGEKKEVLVPSIVPANKKATSVNNITFKVENLFPSQAPSNK